MPLPMFVPSRGRADDRLLKGPAAQVDPRDFLWYVVPEAESETYKRFLNGSGLDFAQVLPCPVSGIAATRQWIGQFCQRLGFSKFVMVDDDVGFLVRRGEDTWRLKAASPEQVSRAMDWLDDALDENAHAAISPREGNNRVGWGPPDTLVQKNTRTLRCLAYRTEEFLTMEHGRVDVMEDFDVNLQLLRAGYSNAVTYWWAQGQRKTGEEGGCSEYRTHAVHEASAVRLAELHPGLVTLREKHNKTDADGFGTRTEVTIQWKSAYRQGTRNV